MTLAEFVARHVRWRHPFEFKLTAASEGLIASIRCATCDVVIVEAIWQKAPRGDK